VSEHIVLDNGATQLPVIDKISHSI